MRPAVGCARGKARHNVHAVTGATHMQVIWRGPRKNGLIKQFLTDVEWGQVRHDHRVMPLYSIM